MSSRRWAMLAVGALLLAGIAALSGRFRRGAYPMAVPASSFDRTSELRSPEESASLAQAARDVSSPELGGIPAAPGRVEVATRRELRVRVVDSARRPLANVPVALAVVGEMEQHDGLVLRTAAPDGIAHFPTNEGAPGLGRPGAHWCVYLPFPGAGARYERVDPTDPPADPIELVAPDLGRLVVKIDDARGHPIEAKGDLLLFPWPAGTLPPPDMQTSTFPFKFPLTGPGECIIDPIATGLRANVQAWLEEYALASVEGDGPQRAGETATLGIRIPRYGPIVTGQLVGADGSPVAELSFSATLGDESDGGAEIAPVDAVTDSEGRFRVDASAYSTEDPYRPRWLHLRGASAGFGDGGRARAALPVPFEEGEYDVGRVSYEVAALLAQGRVIDPQGRGARALVVISPWAHLASRGGRTDPSKMVGGESDESGRFQAHGMLGTHLLVAFARDEHQRESPPVAFQPGAREVVLELRDQGGIEGSLELPPGVPASAFSLFLRRDDLRGSAEAGLHGRVVASYDGAFRWDRVPAGTVDVAVALGLAAEAPAILLVVPGVEVRAGETSRDPRLARIDLRARVAKLPIDVVGPDGSPVLQGTVTLLSPGGSHEPTLTVPLRAGRAEVPAMGASVDVEIRAPGFRRERRLGLVAPARVELREGIAVRLELDAPFDAGPRELDLAVWLHPCGQDPRAPFGPDAQRVLLDARGVARCLLPDPGCFELALELTAAGRLASTPRGYDPGRWNAVRERLSAAFGRPRVEVAERPGEQRVLVPLPPAAVKVLEEVRASLPAR